MEKNKRESYCSSCKGCYRMDKYDFKLVYFYCIDYDPTPIAENLNSIDKLIKKWGDNE